MLDLLLCKERAGHRTVELPRGTVGVEDAMTEKWAHKPMEPLSYKIAQRHWARQRWAEANLFRTSQSRSPISTVMTKIRKSEVISFKANVTCISATPERAEKGTEIGVKTNLDVSRFSGEDLQSRRESVTKDPK